VRKALPNAAGMPADTRNEFLDDLWAWLVGAKVLVPVKLWYRAHGKLNSYDLPGTMYQLNVDYLGFSLTDRRQLCPACRRAQAISPPTKHCPEYGCSGTLEPQGRDSDHYDVYQYTRSRFVPLKTREHTAQVPREDRTEIEGEFKKQTGGRVNCLVCTPTLEMGVDIGKLEMVLMRNAPPTPANYAQRAGRAGRRHRIAVVFSYCRGSSHDRYFFNDPPAMIAGEIRVPAFSMRNEPLIRKHVHSTVLTALRDQQEPETAAAVDHAFPPFVWAYFGQKTTENVDGKEKERFIYVKQPRELSAYKDCLATHQDKLLEELRAVFQKTWPEEDIAAVSDEAMARILDEAPADLQRHVRALFQQVKAYRAELNKLWQLEQDGELDKEEQKRQQRFRFALGRLRRESQDNYTLSYLGVDGYFPGYAMARQSVSARCPEPYLDISRPSSVALRELTPANFIYANREVFRVRKISFHRLKAEDKEASSAVLRRQLVYHSSPERLEEPGASQSEGGDDKAPMLLDSMELTDVEMREKQPIDDREKGRHRVGFQFHGMPLAQHAGGSEAKAGSWTCRLLERQNIRLVNLGVHAKGGNTPFSLFPMCPVCGSTRSPRASEAELVRFAEDHQKSCDVETDSYALHTEFRSDALHIGPFHKEEDATNLIEGIRVGARLVLDMGSTEIEGLTYVSPDGEFWSLMYDPMPGGSGFLPQIVHYWEVICEKARAALQDCPSGCETSCYSCLRHFRNQQAHDQLDRHRAAEILLEIGLKLEMSHTIPPVALQPKAEIEKTDSDAEVNFAKVCEKRGFPVPPVSQYRVDFDGGSYTVADWAYPDQKVLVYVDGMSEKYHGSQKQQMKDAIIRAKLQMMGFSVVAITSEALQDEGSLAVHLEELAIYLEAT